MRNDSKILWSLLHILAIISVLTGLFTGLRIAILDHDYLLQFSRLLPQGEVHTWHIVSACVFSLSAISYTVLRMRGQMYSLSKVRTRNPSIRYHLLINRLLYPISLCSIASGWLLFAENFTIDKSIILLLHYLAALFFALYLLLHGGAWFIEFGVKAFVRMVRPLNQPKQVLLLTSAILVIAPLLWGLMQTVSYHTLVINAIDVNQRIDINGNADEHLWQKAPPITILTHGGANFVNGSTPITLRALQNGAELFMHIEWEDASESLTHLP